MENFESFTLQLLEEAKANHEISKKTGDIFSQNAYLHSSILLAMSALEAFVNSITDEILIEPYDKEYSVHEKALLLEKDVRFKNGEFTLGTGLKMYRLVDRIEFLYNKFSKKKLSTSENWYVSLKQSIDIRNKLVHPKETINITHKQVEIALLAVIDTINNLYKVIYKQKLPVYDRGLTPKHDLFI